MRMKSTLLPIAAIWIAAAAHAAQENPSPSVSVKYRITGLFSPEREQDLRDAAKKMSDVSLSGIDYGASEATFAYDPSKILKGAKPDQVQNHIEGLLKNASNHTFGLKPLLATPREKLQRVEIAVGVLDCKACGYGLFCYTVNDRQRAIELAQWGVDALCTDRLDLIEPTLLDSSDSPLP